jgi:hypothetical protein
MHLQELLFVDDTQTLGKDVFPDENGEIKGVMKDFKVFVFFHFETARRLPIGCLRRE